MARPRVFLLPDGQLWSTPAIPASAVPEGARELLTENEWAERWISRIRKFMDEEGMLSNFGRLKVRNNKQCFSSALHHRHMWMETGWRQWQCEGNAVGFDGGEKEWGQPDTIPFVGE